MQNRDRQERREFVRSRICDAPRRRAASRAGHGITSTTSSNPPSSASP